MISKEEVKHIAKLARLELTETEIQKMQKDLSVILDYVDLLKKAKSPKESQIIKGSQEQLRKDESNFKDNSLGQKIIKSFPEEENDYIKVKSIL